jgi:hypothetical protein
VPSGYLYNFEVGISRNITTSNRGANLVFWRTPAVRRLLVKFRSNIFLHQWELVVGT